MRDLLPSDAPTIEAFTDLYWNQVAPWTKTKWLGVGVAKCPLDLFVFQEIIFETRPDLIIETGSCLGGSALFFASIFDMIGNGHVVTVDKDHYPERPKHQRITYLTEDSVGSTIVSDIKGGIDSEDRKMVVLDSDHSYEHVKAELEAYGSLVTPGCYLVVEDTAVDKSWGKPAAKAALDEWLMSNPGFVVDKSRESHMLTTNPGGWVRREF